MANTDLNFLKYSILVIRTKKNQVKLFDPKLNFFFEINVLSILFLRQKREKLDFLNIDFEIALQSLNHEDY